ncbi:hypothetical protein [Rhizobium sp. MHM7A]|uniref:hypothetical protein n=1 Tax=Rhizobium sp. MHM7A TaxID=2583233 RepID=UPI0011063E75|nr:hypothetical protein [Rhizobium sp. MHM7A]TLX16294.1 hypothetical protein FFR93_02900 [Rhizobium sp. MHM7A]
MGIARYFQLSAIKNGDLVTTTGREVVLRLTDGEEPKGVFVGPVLVSSEDHRANQAGYRNAKAELVAKIQAHLPEADELICLDNKDEIVGHYKVANGFGHEMMRIQQELPSETEAFVTTEAASKAERAIITEMFGLEADDKPLVTIIMNDQFKVAAHVGDDITGSMLDATGTLKPWTAPGGSLMEEVFRNRFPKSAAYAI